MTEVPLGPMQVIIGPAFNIGIYFYKKTNNKKKKWEKKEKEGGGGEGEKKKKIKVTICPFLTNIVFVFLYFIFSFFI